jgi:cytoskeleton protein RodZ
MGELGQLLRQTREERGISLEKVAEETRIRATYLQALEQGEYDALPTPGHVHGFLRNYALYLGLDLDEVEALHAAETSERRFFEPGIFAPKDIALVPRRPLGRASLVLALVIVLVLLVMGGWAFWQYGLPYVQPALRVLTPAAAHTADARAAVTATAVEEAIQARAATRTRAASTTVQRQATATPRTATTAPPTATAAPTTTTAAPQPATATPRRPTATPSPTSTPTATPERSTPRTTPTPESTETPTPVSIPVGGVVLEVKVIERAWLQVTVDEEELPGELLETGEERIWEAENAIYFISGNAGGVEVTVNGEELGTLGGRAEVVERTFTPEGEATPTPAP